MSVEDGASSSNGFILAEVILARSKSLGKCWKLSLSGTDNFRISVW